MKHQNHSKHEGGGHASHIEEFRKKFFICLVLTVPILLLSKMVQDWFGFSITIPLQMETLFFLSLIVYFYGGAPFLKGMYKELKNHQPGMMTLIGMAISVAFFYSAATVFVISGKDFFWELATLVDVMILGHWIEAKSLLGASRALEELVKIMPTTAHLVTKDEIVDVPLSELKKADIVLVRPGEKIPSDGVIVEGGPHSNIRYQNSSKYSHKDKGTFKKIISAFC